MRSLTKLKHQIHHCKQLQIQVYIIQLEFQMLSKPTI